MVVYEYIETIILTLAESNRNELDTVELVGMIKV